MLNKDTQIACSQYVAANSAIFIKFTFELRNFSKSFKRLLACKESIVQKIFVLKNFLDLKLANQTNTGRVFGREILFNWPVPLSV